MTDADAKLLEAKWRDSYYRPRDFKANPKIVAGYTVPIQRGDDLIRSLLENVEEAKRDLEATLRRGQEARQDGILDGDTLDSIRDKKTRLALAEAAKGVIGDYKRAQSELRHWREYAAWAMSNRVTTLPNAQAHGPLIRGLADSKSGARMSPAEEELTDEVVNEGRNRVAAQMEEWQRRQREPGDDDDVLSEVGL